jgi:hypothetical protein
MVSKVPPSGAPQRQQLNTLKEKVAKVEAKIVASAFQKMTTAKEKVKAAKPTFQKSPPQTDKDTRKDTNLAFKRVVK